MILFQLFCKFLLKVSSLSEEIKRLVHSTMASIYFKLLRETFDYIVVR